MSVKDFKYDIINTTGEYTNDMAPVEPGEVLKSTAQNRPVENLMESLKNQVAYLRNTYKNTISEYMLYSTFVDPDGSVVFDSVLCQGEVKATGVTMTYLGVNPFEIIKGSPANSDKPRAHITVSYDTDVTKAQFITIEVNNPSIASQNVSVVIQDDSANISGSTIVTYREEPIQTMLGGSVVTVYTKLRLVLNKTGANIGQLVAAINAAGVGLTAELSQGPADPAPFASQAVSTIMTGTELLVNLVDTCQRVVVSDPVNFFTKFFDGADDRSPLYFSATKGSVKYRFMNVGLYGFVNSSIDDPAGTYASTIYWTNASNNFVYIPNKLDYFEDTFKINPAGYYNSTMLLGEFEFFKSGTTNPFITYNTIDNLPHVNVVPFFVVEPECIRFVNGRSISVDEFRNMQDFIGSGPFNINLTSGVSNINAGQDKASLERFDISDKAGTPYDQLAAALTANGVDPTAPNIDTLSAIAYITNLLHLHQRSDGSGGVRSVGGRILVVNSALISPPADSLMFSTLTDAVLASIDGDNIYLIYDGSTNISLNIGSLMGVSPNPFSNKNINMYALLNGVNPIQIDCAMDSATAVVNVVGPEVIYSAIGGIKFNCFVQFNIVQEVGHGPLAFGFNKSVFDDDCIINYTLEEADHSVASIGFYETTFNRHVYVTKNNATAPNGINIPAIWVAKTDIKRTISFQRYFPLSYTSTLYNIATNVLSFDNSCSYGADKDVTDEQNEVINVMTIAFSGSNNDINLNNPVADSIRFKQCANTPYTATVGPIIFGYGSAVTDSNIDLRMQFVKLTVGADSTNFISTSTFPFRQIITISGANKAFKDNTINVSLVGDSTFNRTTMGPTKIGIDTGDPVDGYYMVLMAPDSGTVAIRNNTIGLRLSNVLNDSNTIIEQTYSSSILRLPPSIVSITNPLGMINLCPVLTDYAAILAAGDVNSVTVGKGSKQLWDNNKVTVNFGNGLDADDEQLLLPHHGGIYIYDGTGLNTKPMPFINFGFGSDNEVNVCGKHYICLRNNNYLETSYGLVFTGILYAYNQDFYFYNKLVVNDLYLTTIHSDKKHSIASPDQTQLVSTLLYGCDVTINFNSDNHFVAIFGTKPNNFTLFPVCRECNVSISNKSNNIGAPFAGASVHNSTWLYPAGMLECNVNFDREVYNMMPITGHLDYPGFNLDYIVGEESYHRHQHWGTLTTANEPTSGMMSGDTYYNSDTLRVYTYNGTSWEKPVKYFGELAILPITGMLTGDYFYLTTKSRIYNYTGGAWVPEQKDWGHLATVAAPADAESIGGDTYYDITLTKVMYYVDAFSHWVQLN